MMDGDTREQVHNISIHALRAERDAGPYMAGRFASISIHALRAERDGSPWQYLYKPGISIHALRAERDFFISHQPGLFFLFQSTRSERSATFFVHHAAVIQDISIHALRAERDSGSSSSCL